METQVIKQEKPNSWEFGKAANRFKIYFDTPTDLKETIKALHKEGFLKDFDELMKDIEVLSKVKERQDEY